MHGNKSTDRRAITKYTEPESRRGRGNKHAQCIVIYLLYMHAYNKRKTCECIYIQRHSLMKTENVCARGREPQRERERERERGGSRAETCLSCVVKQSRLVIQKIQSERCFRERHSG